MPSNTVSRNVQQREAGLQCRLLHRSTRKLTLTDAGEAFLAHCSDAVADIAAVGQTLLEGSGLPAGPVRVAAPANFIDGSSVRWIGDFLRAHPQVRLEFVLSDGRADFVAERIDVAFRATSLVDDGNVPRPLLVNDFVLVASPSYLRARPAPADVAGLADGHDCLTQPRRDDRRHATWRLDAPDGPVQVDVQGRFVANTAGALLEAALAGLGIALLPMLVVAAPLASGRLVRVLPDLRRPGGGLQLVLPSRRQIPRAVAAFADFAVERMRSAAAGERDAP